jgi:Fe2+ transport system protein FeoA
MKFAELAPGAVARVIRVGGQGAFRRRLMELGILPGTRLELVGIAPLGDPMELLVRGASLSIRRAQAEAVEVIAISAEELAREREQERAHAAERKRQREPGREHRADEPLARARGSR